MSYYRLFYHFICTTKHRLPLIEGPVRGAIYGEIRSQAENLNAIIYALNEIEDHIHLAVSVPPSTALSAFMKQIKGSSSHLAAKHTDVFAWQTEFGVHSFSESHLTYITQYIDNQQAHHRMNTINPRLEIVD